MILNFIRIFNILICFFVWIKLILLLRTAYSLFLIKKFCFNFRLIILLNWIIWIISCIVTNYFFSSLLSSLNIKFTYIWFTVCAIYARRFLILILGFNFLFCLKYILMFKCFYLSLGWWLATRFVTALWNIFILLFSLGIKYIFVLKSFIVTLFYLFFLLLLISIFWSKLILHDELLLSFNLLHCLCLYLN